MVQYDKIRLYNAPHTARTVHTMPTPPPVSIREVAQWHGNVMFEYTLRFQEYCHGFGL
jgi:hypothetical protein